MKTALIASSIPITDRPAADNTKNNNYSHHDRMYDGDRDVLNGRKYDRLLGDHVDAGISRPGKGILSLSKSLQ